MKRILVTGGAGFIGTNLVRKLLENGNYVIVVDNFVTGKKSNLDDLEGNKNFRLYEHDITMPFDFGGIDEIYHLASIASVYHYLRKPIETLKVGSIGTLNVLDYSRRYKARLLFTSTSEVYGDPEVHPQDETYRGNVNPIGPRSCYDESKRFGEALVMAYHRVYNLDTRIARIFNTYGPYMDVNDGRIFPNLISQALKNQPLTIYGDGSQTRSYCYVDDTVEALIKLMETDFHLPVNIGNPEEFTILETANILCEELNIEKKFVFLPLPEDDPMRRRPDITRAKEILKWEPKTSLREGLKKTIEWFKKLV
uniref:UDP-glucuronate decarboxylase n=1 Tax=candidate division WOR-3 bacterium TaxID=2052148 RepID=A0A7C4Y6K8_UNCW3